MGQKFITQVVGKPGSGEATVTFRSGAVSTDLQCGQFFMKMQDEGRSLHEARACAGIGPLMAPSVDWIEINRILDSFDRAAGRPE